MTFLLRFWPYLLGAIAIIWLGLLVKGWHDDAQKLPVVQGQFDVYRTATETAAKVRKEVSGEYQSELSTLRAGQRQPAPAVRLCQSPVQADTGTPGGNHGASTTDRELSQGAGSGAQAGPDIGRDLYQLADRADEVTAQLRACQSFVGKIAAE